MFVSSDGVRLALRTSGDPHAAPAVLQLSGGPGCVNYLADVVLDLPARVVSPDPRGVGDSEGGPHGTETALADLESIRRSLNITRWSVVAGHSYGADLALAYSVRYPRSLDAVIAACGTGVQNDRDWKTQYEALKDTEQTIDIAWNADVHRALLNDWRRWIKAPDLLSQLSRLTVPVTFVVAEHDIRASWPIEQLAELVPSARLEVLPGVPHDFWHTHPDRWWQLITAVLAA